MSYLDCLPHPLYDVLASIADVREIRIRNNCPVSVNVSGCRRWLTDCGLTDKIARAFIFDGSCDDIVNKACQGSVYAFETMLAQGYFTLDDGTRFGVCGKYIQCSGVFQSFSSLCLRIPHNVNCMSAETFEKLEHADSVVFVGPPCAGKTTCLRNLAIHLSERSNVVVCDERGELSIEDCLSRCDILTGAAKQYAFSVAVRTLSPDWIVCDELAAEDVDTVVHAIRSGVNVACSVHGSTLFDLQKNFPKLYDSVSMAVLLDKFHNQSPVNLSAMSKN